MAGRKVAQSFQKLNCVLPGLKNTRRVLSPLQYRRVVCHEIHNFPWTRPRFPSACQQLLTRTPLVGSVPNRSCNRCRTANLARGPKLTTHNTLLPTRFTQAPHQKFGEYSFCSRRFPQKQNSRIYRHSGSPPPGPDFTDSTRRGSEPGNRSHREHRTRRLLGFLKPSAPLPGLAGVKTSEGTLGRVCVYARAGFSFHDPAKSSPAFDASLIRGPTPDDSLSEVVSGDSLASFSLHRNARRSGRGSRPCGPPRRWARGPHARGGDSALKKPREGTGRTAYLRGQPRGSGRPAAAGGDRPRPRGARREAAAHARSRARCTLGRLSSRRPRPAAPGGPARCLGGSRGRRWSRRMEARSVPRGRASRAGSPLSLCGPERRTRSPGLPGATVRRRAKGEARPCGPFKRGRGAACRLAALRALPPTPGTS